MVNEELKRLADEIQRIADMYKENFGETFESQLADSLVKIKEQVYIELSDWAQSTNNSRVIEIISNAIYHTNKEKS